VNKKWADLAADMLGLAADDFANHGCDDWKWPADWSAEDRRAFAAAMHEANNRKPEADFGAHEREDLEHDLKGEYGPPNWWVMRFLAARLRGEDG
jgi:hypothetical protein